MRCSLGVSLSGPIFVWTVVVVGFVAACGGVDGGSATDAGTDASVDGGVDGGLPGPAYDALPDCDDPALWALETTWPVGREDRLGDESPCSFYSELPLASVWTGLYARARRACVRALDDRGGFVAGATLDTTGQVLHVSRGLDGQPPPTVALRVWEPNGGLSGRRLTLGAVAPDPVVTLDAEPRGLAVNTAAGGGAGDRFRWATGDGVFEAFEASADGPVRSIPGLLRWLPNAWTVTDRLWAAGADARGFVVIRTWRLPGIDADSRVLEAGGVAGVTVDGAAHFFDIANYRDLATIPLPAGLGRLALQPRERPDGRTDDGVALVAEAEGGLRAWDVETGDALEVADDLAVDAALVRGTAASFGPAVSWALADGQLVRLRAVAARLGSAESYAVEDVDAIGVPVAAIGLPDPAVGVGGHAPSVLLLGDRGSARLLHPGVIGFGPDTWAHGFDGDVRDVVVARTGYGVAVVFVLEREDGTWALHPAFHGHAFCE